jgi:hypothetical protein
MDPRQYEGRRLSPDQGTLGERLDEIDGSGSPAADMPETVEVCWEYADGSFGHVKCADGPELEHLLDDLRDGAPEARVWVVVLLFSDGTSSACLDEFPTHDAADRFAAGFRAGLEWAARLRLNTDLGAS